MSTPRVTVTRPEQLEPGACYRVRGTVDGCEIPPQVVRVESAVEFVSALGVGHCVVTFFTDLGAMGKHTHRAMLPLHEVNIPEHGQHDRHLERIPDELLGAAAAMEAENMDQDYTERVVDDDPAFKGLVSL